MEERLIFRAVASTQHGDFWYGPFEGAFEKAEEKAARWAVRDEVTEAFVQVYNAVKTNSIKVT